MDNTRTIESRYMQMGDRIVVEPKGAPEFVARVHHCMGWSLVHGVMDWAMERENGSGFTYSIHIDAPVRVVRPAEQASA